MADTDVSGLALEKRRSLSSLDGPAMEDVTISHRLSWPSVDGDGPRPEVKWEFPLTTVEIYLAWISTARNSPNISRREPPDRGSFSPEAGHSSRDRGRLAQQTCYVVRRNGIRFHQGTLIGLSSIPDATMIGKCALR